MDYRHVTYGVIGGAGLGLGYIGRGICNDRENHRKYLTSQAGTNYFRPFTHTELGRPPFA
jgi:hypothetical protein